MVSKKAEQGQEETFPTACKVAHRSMMVVAIVLRLPQEGPTPGFWAYNNTTSLKLMLFSYSKARPVDESSFVMFPGRDGRTADAEHRRGQRRHMHVVYGPPS